MSERENRSSDVTALSAVRAEYDEVAAEHPGASVTYVYALCLGRSHHAREQLEAENAMLRAELARTRELLAERELELAGATVTSRFACEEPRIGCTCGGCTELRALSERRTA